MKKKILAIIQARMGSARLPGKTMKKILGKPMLYYIIERASMSKKIDDIVVATSDTKKDDIIEKFCKKQRIKCFRGSEDDVLSRFYGCAKKYNGDIIVRICGDSPFIDPIIIDDLIKEFHGCDCLTNAVRPFVPKGVDLEVFSFETLSRINKYTQDKDEREHVTKYAYKNPNKFKIKEVYPDKNLYRPDIKLTVDTEDDLTLARELFGKLYKKNKGFMTEDVISFLDNHPITYLNKLGKNRVNVIIRADPSIKYGLGHFNRCLILSKELKTVKQFTSLFVIRKYDGYEKPVKDIWCGRILLIEADKTYDEEMRILKSLNPDIVIADLDYRSVDDSYYQKLTDNFTSIVIDDMGANKIESKVIINESIVEARQEYKKSIKPFVFAGPNYMILKEGFRKFNKKNKVIRKDVKKVLVSLGGSDPKNNLERVINILTQNKNINITIVLGKAYPTSGIIKSKYKSKNIKILEGINNMYALMFKSDLIICNGGVTVYEANCIGTPSVIIPQNVEEEGTEKRFSEHGSSILIKNPTKNRLKRVLWLSQKEREGMSKKGKSLVDGDGLKRVKNIITFTIINEILKM